MTFAQPEHTTSSRSRFGKSVARVRRPPVQEGSLGRSIPTTALARLMEQATRGLHSLGHDGDLYPAQWAALRYLATSEPEQRTAMAVARFQGLAFGPVSRTVRTLVAKGLLRKAGSAGRGRAELIELTAAGRKLMSQDPLNVVRAAIDDLPEPERESLASALEAILRAVHERHDPPKGKPKN